MLLTVVLVVACAVAATTDVATRRVPNVLTFGLAAVAMVAVFLAHGVGALLVACLAYVAMLCLGSVAYGRGWFGGGDVKLVAAGTLCAGWPGALTFILATGLAGGALALAELLRQRRLRLSLTSFATAFASGNLNGVVIDPERRRLPYALAITGGALTLLASETIAPWLQLIRV